MNFIKKYWYAIFGVFVFPFLAFHTTLVYKKATDLTFWRLFGNFLLCFFIVGVPSAATQLVLIWRAQNPFTTGLPAIVFYLTSILAAFLHIQFRVKHGISKKST